MSSSSLTITLSSSLRSSSSLPLLLHRHVHISSVLCTHHLYLPQKQLTSRHLLRRCSINSDNSDLNPWVLSVTYSTKFLHFEKSSIANLSAVVQGKVYESPEFQNSPLDQKGTAENDENSQRESLTSNNILTRLRRYGVAGVLSYGLLNTAYYLTTFLIVWFYVAPSPGRMGYLAAVERFLKVMVMVWAGSQVTKLVRAGGALALAPFVDIGLSWFTTKMNFESQRKAFMVIAGFCFGLALMMFLIVTLLWA